MIPQPALFLVGTIGFQEIIIILIVALLLFGGGKKIGDIGRGLGDGIRNFKSAIKGEDEKPDEKKTEEKKPA
jgi:sec-independent protein translocase protein TatA